MEWGRRSFCGTADQIGNVFGFFAEKLRPARRLSGVVRLVRWCRYCGG